MSANVIDVTDSADPRLDDFRDLNSVDRRPDLPTGKGLVIAEGVLVVQRMLASRFTARAMLGTDRRLAELGTDLDGVAAPYYRASADVMAEVVGFHLNRGVLASAPRPPELTVARYSTVRVPSRSSKVSTTTRTSAPSSAMPPASTSTQSCSAADVPTLCTGAPSGYRWVTRCWCRTPGPGTGQLIWRCCGTTGFACWR